MRDEEAKTATVRVLLRRADEQVLSQAAKERKQSLGQFVREVLEVAAADARHGPVAQISWVEIYSRGAGSQPPEEDDESITYSPPRPARPPRLSVGPPSKPQ
jgi:hypothetical protein